MIGWGANIANDYVDAIYVLSLSQVGVFFFVDLFLDGCWRL